MDLLLNCAGRGGELEEEYPYARGRAEAGAPKVKLRRSKSLGKGCKTTPKPQWHAGSASRVVQSMLDEVTVLREENLRLRREKEYNRASLVFNPEQELALAANIGLKLSAPASRPTSLALPEAAASEMALHYAVVNVSGGVTSQRQSQMYSSPHSSAVAAQRQSQIYATPYSSSPVTSAEYSRTPTSATNVTSPGHSRSPSAASGVTSPGHSRSPSAASGVTSAGISRSPSTASGLTSPRSSLVLTPSSRPEVTSQPTRPWRDLPPIPQGRRARASVAVASETPVGSRPPSELPAVPVPQISLPSTLGSQCSRWSEDSGFREAGDSVNASHYETLDHYASKAPSPRESVTGKGLHRENSLRSSASTTPTGGPQGPRQQQTRTQAGGARPKRPTVPRGRKSAESPEGSQGSSGAGSPVEVIPKQLEALAGLIEELTLASARQSREGGPTPRGPGIKEELSQCLGSVLTPQLTDLSRQFHAYQEEQKVRHDRLISGQQRIAELTLESKTKVTTVQNDLMKLIAQGRDKTREQAISEDVTTLPEYVTAVGLAIQDKFGMRERVGEFFRQMMNPGVVDYICMQQQELSPRALFWRLLCELSRLLEREGKVISLNDLLVACEACKISPLKCKLMPRRHQAVIDLKYSYLVDNLMVSEVLPYLHDSGLLTSELQAYVLEGRTSREKVCRLVSVLPVLGDQAFALLLSALATSQQPHIERELREELARQMEEEEMAQQAQLARSVQDSLLAKSPDGSGQTVLSRLAGVLETTGSGTDVAAGGGSSGAGQLAILQILAALRASIKDLQAVCLQNSESLALLHRQQGQTSAPHHSRHFHGSDVIDI